MMEGSSDTWLTAVGHASVVVATALGLCRRHGRSIRVVNTTSSSTTTTRRPIVVVVDESLDSSSCPSSAVSATVAVLGTVGAGIVAAASIVAAAARWSTLANNYKSLKKIDHPVP
jgi:hypothetical protein